jgi:molybdopterin converting factor subunit 1
MKVRVKLFAVAKELAGRDELEAELQDGATVADVRAAVEQNFDALRNILRHAMWAVDGQYASDDDTLTERSEVALIPPVSGG